MLLCNCTADSPAHQQEMVFSSVLTSQLIKCMFANKKLSYFFSSITVQMCFGQGSPVSFLAGGSPDVKKGRWSLKPENHKLMVNSVVVVFVRLSWWLFFFFLCF